MKYFLLPILFILCLIGSNSYAEEPSIAKKVKEESQVVKVEPVTATKDVESMAFNVYAGLYRKTVKFAKALEDRIFSKFVPFVLTLITLFVSWQALQTLIKNEEFITFLMKNISYIGYLVLVLFAIISYDNLTQSFWRFFTSLGTDVLKISSDLINGNEDTGNIKYAFHSANRLYQSVDYITAIYLKTMNQDGGFVTRVANGFYYGIQGLILTMVYFAVYCAFVIMYTLQTITMLIFFSFGKVLILLSMFPPARFVLKSWLESILTFGLSVVFVCIAMSLTLFATEDTIKSIIQDAIAGRPLPHDSYSILLLLGFLSLFFHISSSNFATMLTKAHVQNFGGTATAIGSMAMGATKAAPALGMKSAPGIAAAGSQTMAGAKAGASYLRGKSVALAQRFK